MVSCWSAATAHATYRGANGPILFGAGGDVWSVAADGSALTDLTDLPGGAGSGSDPSGSANGVVAFVVGSGSAAEIWTMRVDGSNPRQITSNSAIDTMPSISENGSTIAFVSDRGGDADVWTMAADGSGAAALLTAPGAEEYPQFSPKGDYVIAATHFVPTNLDLGYVPATGGPHPAATQITGTLLDETAPAPRPDQVRVGYTRGGDIFTAYYDGTDEFPFPTTAAAESFPSFSPDGTKVVYAAPTGLVIADSGGLNQVALPTPGAASPTMPDWATVPPSDRSAPQTTITKRPRRHRARPRARFRFTSSEPGSSFECSLDGAGYRACASPLAYRHLDRGRHRFRVRATDAAGNVDPSPADARFKVAAPRSS